MSPDHPTQPEGNAAFLFSAPRYPDYDKATAREQIALNEAARQHYLAAPPTGPGEPAPPAGAEPPTSPAATAEGGAVPAAVEAGGSSGGNGAAAAGPVPVVQPIPMQSFDFLDSLPRNVLTSYLARAVQMEGMCTDYPGVAPSTGLLAQDITLTTLDTILRAEADFLLDVGAKFIGRVAGWWGQWQADFELARLPETAAYLHSRDPQLVLQACVFEYIAQSVQEHSNAVGMLIPRWAWDEFYPGQPYRWVFNVYDAANHEAGMLFDDSYPVPPTDPTAPPIEPEDDFTLDITRTETKMWVYWRAVRYLDAGCEAIHFGQVNMTGSSDPTNEHWWDVLSRIRAYAAGRKGPYYDNVLGRPLRQWPTAGGWRGARRGGYLRCPYPRPAAARARRRARIPAIVRFSLLSPAALRPARK